MSVELSTSITGGRGMRMRRLGWAGVEIECDDEVLVIDYVRDTTFLPLRDLREVFPRASRPGGTAAALVTHLHGDHADPAALVEALGANAPVFRPERAAGHPADLELTAFAERRFDETSLAVEIIAAWQERRVGPFRVFAVPAVDGFGDPQIGWVVECGGSRILHAGDTLFHGSWWRIARRFGPIDVAFLPINAPTCDLPHLQPPSPVGAVMDPTEAATAAHILGARSVVPIHYGSLHRPPLYRETADPIGRLERRARELGVLATPREPGHWFAPGAD